MDKSLYYEIVEAGIKYRKNKAKCYLYLVESTSGHIKIGIAQNPIKRFKQLVATQGPYVYDLIKICPYIDRESAEIAERDFHNIFSKHRVNGEWFTLGVSEVLYLGAELSLHGDLYSRNISMKEYYELSPHDLSNRFYNGL